MLANSLFGTARLAVLAASVGCALAPGVVDAMEIDTGNPDVAIRFDNTIRYNLGVRAQSQDKAIMNTPGNGNSDAKFDRGDVISSRIDLLSELDVVYKDVTGFRISAAGWYDAAYNDKEKLGPLGTSNYPGREYTGFVKRWNRGPSGELLDAFIFSRIELGDTSTMLRLGRHNIYWGESLFSFVHGVSYGQGPVDTRKATVNPGVEAKELYMPLNQLSITSQISDTLTLAAQYYLDWEPTRSMDGGTYFGIVDYMTAGGGTMISPTRQWIGIHNKPDDRSGDWGVMARWSPEWLGGSVGLYYREYTDKIAQIVADPTFTRFGFTYQEDRSKLWGVSLSKNIGGVIIGAEVAHRTDSPLLMGNATTLGSEPVGDTWHALINATGYVGKTALFDSMAWLAEVTYSTVDKVTKNERNFKKKGSATGCPPPNDLGCTTADHFGVAVRLEPKWFQVFDGVDLSMPLFYRNNFGSSPVLFGGYDGNGSYSAGLTAEIFNKHTVTLAYNGYFARHKDGIGATGLRQVLDAGALGYHWDRANVTLTYKTAF
jgi:hypothetical protein